MASAIATAVLSEHQLRCAAIVLLKPRSIPKTTSGKIQRSGTKAAYEARTLAVQYLHKGHEPRKEVNQPVKIIPVVMCEQVDMKMTVGPVKTPNEILAWLVERLGSIHDNEGETSEEENSATSNERKKSESVDPETPWACLGMDSVAIVGLSAELGEFLGVVVPPSAFFQFDTPAKLAAAPGLATGDLETNEQGGGGSNGAKYMEDDGVTKTQY